MTRGLDCARYQQPTPWMRLKRACRVVTTVWAVLLGVLFAVLVSAYVAGGQA